MTQETVPYVYDKSELKQVSSFLATSNVLQFSHVSIGFCLVGPEIRKNFFRVACPCGIEVTYPINGLPEVDTLMPCGNPNHWAVKYEEHYMDKK
jgi:hypothetical protein